MTANSTAFGGAIRRHLDGMGGRDLGLFSWLLFGWSLTYAIPHLYWCLGGTFGFFALKPSATEVENFEAANLLAFLMIAVAGGFGFALQRLDIGINAACVAGSNRGRCRSGGLSRALRHRLSRLSSRWRDRG